MPKGTKAISKPIIEAVLIGEITTHAHPGGTGAGDVVGPATNSADYLPQWNGANSKTLKNGLAVPAGGLAGITALGDKVDKVTGSSLVTDTEITKLVGIATGAEVNVNADWSSGSGDSQILNKPTISGSNTGDNATNTQYSGLDAAKQATLVSATNIKTINSTTILGAGDLVVTGADPFLAKLVLGADKPTGANTTPVTLGLSFNYIANKKYIIDIYGIVAPTAAGTGCGFLIDVSSAVTYVGTFTIHQLAATGTVSGGSSIGDLGATSQGISSGMVGTGSNFVSGSALVVTGANAGTATFFFRSETTAVTTCKANTVIRVMEV